MVKDFDVALRMTMRILDILIASRLQWPLERGELELLLVERARTA